jgi:isopropylmalate/homocitrate/citramalate synthase
VARIKIVDGTLREGEQSPGVFFTKEEKVQIAAELDRIGVPLLDVGMPSVSTEEREAISAIAREGLSASIGVSIRLNRDEVDQALACGVGEVFIICPVSALHLRYRLAMDEEAVRGLAEDVVLYACQKGLLVNFVAEDASRAEIPFLCDLLRRAHHWGARRAFICDTVGVMEPFGMRDLVKRVRQEVSREMELGVHCHNDFGLATANTLAAIEAGVQYPSVTVNGIGERAGNPPLQEVVVALENVLHRAHGIDMQGLHALSQLVERCSGIFISPHSPIVGLNAFRHESGIHVDGILKKSDTYEGIDPHEVGKNPSFVLGKHTGTRTIRHLLKERGYEANEEELKEILRRIKERKAGGGKKDARRMVREVRLFYERYLNFPYEAFWEIVEGVLMKDD